MTDLHRRAAAIAVGTALLAGAVPATAGAAVLWSADHETVDFSQWTANQGRAIFNSTTGGGTAVAAISDDVSRSGDWSMKMSITGATGKHAQGVRVFRRWLRSDGRPVPLPKEGYYSAWFWFPERVQTVEWWNVFQFKSHNGTESKPMLSFNVGNGADGKMLLYVFHKRPDGSGVSYEARSEKAARLPVGRWAQVEAYLRRSTATNGKVNNDGRLSVWVDGRKIINRTGIPTLQDPKARLHWSLNNYTDDVRPANPTIYFDDAAISTTRLGVRSAGTSAGQNPPPPDSITLGRGTRAWRTGLVLAKKAWTQNFVTTTGRQVTMVAKSRNTTGRRAFVADVRCGGKLVGRGFGRRGKQVRFSFKRPPSSCVLRFRSGKQKVQYRATLAVSNR